MLNFTKNIVTLFAITLLPYLSLASNDNRDMSIEDFKKDEIYGPQKMSALYLKWQKPKTEFDAPDSLIVGIDMPLFNQYLANLSSTLELSIPLPLDGWLEKRYHAKIKKDYINNEELLLHLKYSIPLIELQNLGSVILTGKAGGGILARKKTKKEMLTDLMSAGISLADLSNFHDDPYSVAKEKRDKILSVPQNKINFIQSGSVGIEYFPVEWIGISFEFGAKYYPNQKDYVPDKEDKVDYFFTVGARITY